MIVSADYRTPQTVLSVYDDQELGRATATEAPTSALYRVDNGWRPYIRRGARIPSGYTVIRGATTPPPVSATEEPKPATEATS